MGRRAGHFSRIVFFFRGDDPSQGRGMLQKGIVILKRSWPLGFVALPFAIVYCFLLCFFADAIEASYEMRAFTITSEWGDVDVLFMIASIALGWVGVVVSERRTGAERLVPLVMAVPWCLASIGGGFVLARLFLVSLSDPMWEMLAYSLVSAVGTSALRAYLPDII